jgi:hypothetical protein
MPMLSYYGCVRSEVLTAVKISMVLFRAVTPYIHLGE